MSTSLFLDKVLSVYLSEGMMVFTAVLLIAAIIAFIKGKGRRALRAGCVAVGIYCIIYLGAVLVLSSLFGSNHKPSPPVIFSVVALYDDTGYFHAWRRHFSSCKCGKYLL